MAETIPFRQHDFNTGLCDCFSDCDSCLEAYFCAHCQVSQQYNVLTTGRREMNPLLCLAMLGADMCGAMGVALAIGTIVTRGEVRMRLGLTDETSMQSCCRAFWCVGCSICQTYREMSIRHVWPGGICVNKPYVRFGLQAPQMPAMNPQPGGGADGGVPVYGVPVPQHVYNNNNNNNNYVQYSNGGGYPPQHYPPQQGGGGYAQPPPQGGGGYQNYQQQPQPYNPHQQQQSAPPAKSVS